MKKITLDCGNCETVFDLALKQCSEDNPDPYNLYCPVCGAQTLDKVEKRDE